jgi:hypothetical protein
MLYQGLCIVKYLGKNAWVFSLNLIFSSISLATYPQAIDLEPEYIARQVRLIAARAYAETAYNNHDYQGRDELIVGIHRIEERIWAKIPFKYTTSAIDGIERFNREDAGSIYRSNQEVVIAFHGSTWVDDWLHNIKSFKSEYSADSSSKLHSGFKHIIDQSFEPMIRSLKVALSDRVMQMVHDAIEMEAERDDLPFVAHNWSNKKDFSFIFTGHSLGGALSILAATRLWELQERLSTDCNINISGSGKPFPNQIKAITFSAPRVGDLNMVNEIRSKLQSCNILQFQCAIDPTPHLPLRLFEYEGLGCNLDYLGIEQVNDKVKKGLDYLVYGQGAHIRTEVLGRYANFISPIANFTIKLAAQGTPVAVASVVSGVAGTLIAVTELTVATVKLLHEVPTEETVWLTLKEYQKHRVNLSQDLYCENDSPGAVDFISVQRNPIMRFLYSLF